MRVLVVEDQQKTAAFIRKALVAEGYAVDVVGDGEAALSAVGNAPYDAIILDIMLPGRDGISVLRILRKAHVKTPVLLLSARGEVDERVEGLNAGADDYVPKPFVLAELVARVRALGRRGTEPPDVVLRVGDLSLDLIKRHAHRQGKTIELSTREFRLLETLMREPGRIYSRMELLEKAWDYHFDPGTNVVDTYVSRLREKIDAGFSQKLVHTIRAVGFTLQTPS